MIEGNEETKEKELSIKSQKSDTSMGETYNMRVRRKTILINDIESETVDNALKSTILGVKPMHENH